MRRNPLALGLLAFVMFAGLVAPSYAQDPAAENPTFHSPMVFDDQGYHPNMLRPGTAEYDQALKRQANAAQAKPAADPARLEQALERCSLISPLSQATHDKCEIRAHQAALP